ncbi:MAG: GNAT family N-acetyltransferase, partial [Actinomycetota bacterium]|nr:GNAT family N-acetyltransferase [Actinomycetota bacterium]
GYRRATARDVDALTEHACRLHVEDRMGPPIARSNRPAVRARMSDSIVRGLTFVVERNGVAVAKLDLSLRSRRRGAQIAGVYVMPAYRGQGIAGGAVATLARELLAEGLPGVTLHVRADNAAAIAAYRRAGLTDRGPWTLALR